uniref:NADH-ubiquinone oxidoreductase chain 1 n=3 Tax=Formica TaxID=72766 RepID=A0A872YN87_9HYME|nr:NADH dehydrogenase subunit 1 [Formica rufibarbis]QOY24481.1 NADH dehydrogenase subunit 1 [Formica sp. DM656]QOY24508.1 NADH dehydrogenase subunit 1 [Formica sp. DM659]
MLNGFYQYVKLNMLNLLILLIMLLVGIAFLTLLERKILGYVQMRKGPNKVSIIGIFQPFSDAIKLLNKELFYVYKSNYNLFYLCPVLSFSIMLMSWMLFPYITNIYFLNYSMLLLILLMSIGGYIMIFMGWSSNSIYSMMGSMRSVSQMLSYEVSFILIILILMIMSESYSFLDFMNYQVYVWYLFIFYPLFLMYFISVLAELNRSPMDFIEGESELVSGFNIEYFSGGFTLIFLAEYGMIIFFSFLSVLLFTNLFQYSSIFMFMFIIMMSCLVIFMRGLLPRMRYDELMYLCWKIILPMILLYVLLILSFKFFLMMII